MTAYTFSITDTGYIGKAFEMAVKDALERRNANRVSAQGVTDFRYGKFYDVKQNGTVLQYNPGERMIKGSSRVIYATHVAYEVVAQTSETISVTIDLGNTKMFCLDRATFLEFLLNEKGYCKVNESRGTVNIQTVWNYKKNAWHGAKGKHLEAWMAEHQVKDDPIVATIKYAYKMSL